MSSIEILRPGPLATIQDLGRFGHGSVGIGRSGAADLRSFRQANGLVGNHESAAAIEITLGGIAARFDGNATIAVTGAPSPVTVDEVEVPLGEAVAVSAGAIVRLRAPRRGLRSYLAVRGGIDVPPVLGSRSTDVLSGLGPPILTSGTRLPIGGAVVGSPAGSAIDPLPDDFVLTVLPGPRADWFAGDALATLCSSPYTVTTDSNRVGLRLDGPPVVRTRVDELPTEGIVPGAIQVPPAGRPVVFLSDHPVTGGYPVLAVVTNVWLAAQARPGQDVRFRMDPAGGDRVQET